MINWNGKITMRKETYIKKEGCKTFPKKATETETMEIDSNFYNNYVDSIPFFSGYWDGKKGYCRAEKGYTYAGYIPVIITTISPWKDKKIVATFNFEM